MTGSGLHAGIGGKSLHVAIDMQVLFDSHPDWGVADLRRILPQVRRLAESRPDRTICTRFVPARRPEDAAPGWQRYYRHWRSATLEHAGTEVVALVEELAGLPLMAVIDKAGYAVQSSPDFAPLLDRHEINTLILSGVETDVCVWATAQAAIDQGLRVIIAADAVTSGDSTAHQMILKLAADRFGLQIELATVDEIIAAWPAG